MFVRGDGFLKLELVPRRSDGGAKGFGVRFRFIDKVVEGQFGVGIFVDSGEGVGDRVGFPGLVENVVVELGQFFLPAGLTAGESFLSFEVLQRLVICDNGKLRAQKVETESAKSIDDGEQFLLMSGVVGLSGGELAGVEGNGSCFLDRRSLTDPNSGSDGGSVRDQKDRIRRAVVEGFENWCLIGKAFDLFECDLLSSGPTEGFFSCEFGKRSSYLRETGTELGNVVD